MTARDLAIGAVLVASGVATMGLIVSPMVTLKGTSHVVGSLISDRWYDPPAAPKADLLVAIVDPSLLDPAPIGPSDGAPIEQARERKIFDQQVEINEKEYKREAADVCERHGMHKHYFHRHHHLVWRCRRGQ